MASVATPGSLECLASMSKVAAFQATEERRLESALVRPLEARIHAPLPTPARHQLGGVAT